MFITLEGSEGSGKTSQIQLLAQALRQSGYSVMTTREPGGTKIGDSVRAVLHDLGNTAMHTRTEILLFQASRAQLVEEVIRPQLQQGGIVLCDRYADSTLAYQGFGRGEDLEQLRLLIRYATCGLKPDLTLFLDLDVEEGLHRRSHGGEWNRLDALELEFYKRVRQGYYSLVKEEPERWVIVDAAQTPEKVSADILAIVVARLQAKRYPPCQA